VEYPECSNGWFHDGPGATGVRGPSHQKLAIFNIFQQNT